MSSQRLEPFGAAANVLDSKYRIQDAAPEGGNNESLHA